MFIKKYIYLLLFLTSYLSAGSINIAVAANVSYALDALKKEFKKTNPDTTVNVILGSSGKLTALIKNGAPYDLFMSADMDYPNSLYKDKKAQTYALGRLALLSTKEQDFKQGLALLKNPNY